MNKDRIQICTIVSEMLDHPDEHGIYPTSTAYTRLEHYCEQVRTEALGWAHAKFCVDLDKGRDPRLEEIPKFIEKSKIDLDD